MKTCAKCGTPKPLEEFYSSKRSKDGKYSYCKSCTSAYQSGLYTGPRRQEILDKKVAYTRGLRQQVLDAYGRKCACCGETTEQFLTLDHVDGGGSAHRKKRKGVGVYLDVIRQNFPSDYQLLCFNCNGAKGMYGSCPHQYKDR